MKSIVAVILVGGLALVGCKKEEPKPVPPATPAPTPQAAPAQPAQPAPIAAAQDALKEVQAKGQAAAKDAVQQGRTAVDAASAQGRTAVDTVIAQGRAAVDTAAAGGRTAVNAATTQPSAGDLAALASQKLDEAVKYLKENKLDLADKLVSELESHKASLPAAIQQRVGEVRTLLDTAKAGKLGGLSLPKF